jgi:hypothetical protein
MNNFVTIIKGDYLQRTRSYAFLVTLAISLYVAYTFIPALDAPYTTVKIGKFIGEYNSAWIGHVTAMMTSVFLSMIGFYLVNNSLRKDIETEVGMIIATTRVSNFKYLLSKTLSNFLVLLSIMGIVFMMSVFIFFYRSEGFPFEITQFILPYLFVTVPSLFLISVLAVVAEVFLGRRSVIQYIAFFILFNVVIANVQIRNGSEMLTYLDPFGVEVVSMGMENFVKTNFDEESRIMSMGFNFGDKKNLQPFVFDGIDWPMLYLLSRVLWIVFGVGLVYLSSKFFHRFDLKEKIRASKKSKILLNASSTSLVKDLKLSMLPPIVADYGIIPFIKTELLMLFRKGPRWFWLVNVGGMIALIFVPIEPAHQIVLPILWFLQIGRISDLTTKEKTNRIHYFTYAAYRPLMRLLPSQLIAGITLAIVLASPLIARYAVSLHFLPILGILLGAFFIVMLASFLGILSGGKKLFEVLFFAITYGNLNRIPFADYFGSMWATPQPVGILIALILFFTTMTVVLRRYEIKHV